MRILEQALVDGLELGYELRGAGEPVVLVHWGVSAAWAEPLLHEPVLADGFRLLSYHRAGFGGSSAAASPSVADHAEHCRLLMRRLGIERAHIVGHSSSAAVALQLALDAPEAVHTLALLEPARPTPPTDLQAAFRRDVVEAAAGRYAAGDTVGAVATWAQGVFGPGYRDAAERGLPGLIDRCVADADAFFAQELPALQRWSFMPEDASAIVQPALVVVGERTEPSFPERSELLRSWLPNGESFELPGATHLLHLQNAEGMAEALAAFYARHPL
jgi:pimeloyl-ACP methyl ester carboxylesterase